MNEFLANEAATINLAERLANALPSDYRGWTVLLEGELGAGKSTLARALIGVMGHEGPIPSPTYTLVEPYELARGRIYHVDLYRIAGVEELRYLGWTELDDGLRLVEWPDRAPQLAAQADLRITLHYEKQGRRAEIEVLQQRAQSVLSQLMH